MTQEEQIRTTAAIAAMHAIISSERTPLYEGIQEDVADYAVKFADALVQNLMLTKL